MTPARTGRWHSRGRICQLLVSLGLPRKEVYKQWTCERTAKRRMGSFWQREQGHLDLWFERAHTAYRSHMMSLHMNERPESEVLLMNAIWRQTKRLFKQHGVTE
jgi:hypothetical protein